MKVARWCGLCWLRYALLSRSCEDLSMSLRVSAASCLSARRLSMIFGPPLWFAACSLKSGIIPQTLLGIIISQRLWRKL